jgi:hypothetical protein
MQRLKSKHSPFIAAGGVGGAEVTVGPETGNKITLGVQLTDPNGEHVSGCRPVTAYLSDTAQGKFAAAAPSGGWSNGARGVITNLQIGKAALFWCEPDGTFDIEVTEATAKTFYVIFVFSNGDIVSTPIVFV